MAADVRKGQGNVELTRVHVGEPVGQRSAQRLCADSASLRARAPSLPSPVFHAAGRPRPRIGYYEPYATSHEALDRDTALQQEVRGAAKTLVDAVRLSRAGRFPHVDVAADPRPK